MPIYSQNLPFSAASRRAKRCCRAKILATNQPSMALVRSPVGLVSCRHRVSLARFWMLLCFIMHHQCVMRDTSSVHVGIPTSARNQGCRNSNQCSESRPPSITCGVRYFDDGRRLRLGEMPGAIVYAICLSVCLCALLAVLLVLRRDAVMEHEPASELAAQTPEVNMRPPNPHFPPSFFV